MPRSCRPHRRPKSSQLGGMHAPAAAAPSVCLRYIKPPLFNLPDDQRAALALRVLDRRTALSKVERAKTAIETRWNKDDPEYLVIDVDHQVSTESAAKPKKTRIRTEVAKQAAVSERRVQACAAIRREHPEAYQRIVEGKSTIREEKAPVKKAEREAIKGIRGKRMGDADNEMTFGQRGGPVGHLAGHGRAEMNASRAGSNLPQPGYRRCPGDCRRPGADRPRRVRRERRAAAASDPRSQSRGRARSPAKITRHRRPSRALPSPRAQIRGDPVTEMG
jgi:hypothetical protein